MCVGCRYISRTMAERHATRLWRAGERAVWTGVTLPTQQDPKGVADVAQKQRRRGKRCWRRSGCRTRPQSGRLQGWIRTEGAEWRASGAAEIPCREVKRHQEVHFICEYKPSISLILRIVTKTFMYSRHKVHRCFVLSLNLNENCTDRHESWQENFRIFKITKYLAHLQNQQILLFILLEWHTIFFVTLY